MTVSTSLSVHAGSRTTLGARISIDALSMEYATSAGRVRALDGVTLAIGPASSVAIVGPSGSGKSTLLGIIGGLELPTGGEVRVNDDVISALPDAQRAALRRRMFGFVFQSDNLQPFLTVTENVGLQAVLAGVSDEPAHIHSLLEQLDVAVLARRFPDQLSGGQRQRVAIARALIHGPGVLLADEPTGSLDGASADRVVELLLQVQRLSRTTLVVVTHDRSVAERMDVMVEMDNGRVSDSKEARS
ncbi:ABC transporter ATP-binding protein [Salinibacterium sp.]|uniref:ABC transporter ATP-binding protein n=1 Tax=Salinibacterium sp. TaxID=1915057 RepID=UPI00286ABF9E|nr:ABC transporter ATP-binding protein [Salinibacterium sp.]